VIEPSALAPPLSLGLFLCVLLGAFVDGAVVVARSVSSVAVAILAYLVKRESHGH
jgi:hypothetical protein